MFCGTSLVPRARLGARLPVWMQSMGILNTKRPFLIASWPSPCRFSRIVMAQDILDPPPSAKDWADLSKLPDWSRHSESIGDAGKTRKSTKHPTPWTPEAAEQIALTMANEKAGHPRRGIFVVAFLKAMPSWMLLRIMRLISLYARTRNHPR